MLRRGGDGKRRVAMQELIRVNVTQENGVRAATDNISA